MNAFIQKAAEFLGIPTQRVSQMTEHETRQLQSAGEQIAAVETEKENAFAKIAELEAIILADQQEIDSNKTQLSQAQEAFQESEKSLQENVSKIEQLENAIAEKDAKIAELEETIANLPGAADTKVKVGEEEIHTTVIKDQAPKYWTSADAELAEFQSKFKKKTTK